MPHLLIDSWVSEFGVMAGGWGPVEHDPYQQEPSQHSPAWSIVAWLVVSTSLIAACGHLFHSYFPWCLCLYCWCCCCHCGPQSTSPMDLASKEQTKLTEVHIQWSPLAPQDTGDAVFDWEWGPFYSDLHVLNHGKKRIPAYLFLKIIPVTHNSA